MSITWMTRCPHCRGADFYRIARKSWMRLMQGSRRYQCRICRRRFLVVEAGKKAVEHRKSPRVPVAGKLEARTEPDGRKLGPVADISTGGLSFRYVADRFLPSGLVSVRLSKNGSPAWIRGITAATVFDRPTGESAPFSHIAMRQRGLQFVGHTRRQKAMLAWLQLAARFSALAANGRNADHRELL
jgi:hypothetical protein